MRSYLIGASLALLGLAVTPSPGMAQFGGGLGGGGFGGGYAGNGDLAVQGYIQGRVASVDRSQGLVRISSGRQTVTLNATPDQLSDVVVGQWVETDYSQFGSRLWAGTGTGSGSIGGGGFGGSGFGMGGSGEFAQEGQINGVVGEIDQSRGRVEIDNKVYRAHPADLQGLLPGQFVSVGFRRIGTTNWLDTWGGGGFGGGGFGGGGGGNFGGNMGGGGLGGSSGGSGSGSGSSGQSSGSGGNRIP